MIAVAAAASEVKLVRRSGTFPTPRATDTMMRLSNLDLCAGL
jgi:hypothetical protein